jgi:hypothetical protein
MLNLRNDQLIRNYYSASIIVQRKTFIWLVEKFSNKENKNIQEPKKIVQVHAIISKYVKCVLHKDAKHDTNKTADSLLFYEPISYSKNKNKQETFS